MKHKHLIISAIFFICLLVVGISLLMPTDFSDNMNTSNQNSPSPHPSAPYSAPVSEPVIQEDIHPEETESPKQAKDESPAVSTAASDETKDEHQEDTVTDSALTAEENNTPTCTMSIRCDSIFKGEHTQNPKKLSFLPQNGIIFPESDIEFEAGDTVFDILLKVTRDNKIHLEFESTPMFNSMYIEGINNLYEFDFGELSGWLFSVNGEFYGHGSSSHKVENGDIISWVYSCDLGRDVGGYVPGDLS